MKGYRALIRFLEPDARDAGCDATLAVMAIYAEAIIAGRNAALRFPGVATHLRHCDPCVEDLRGVLFAAGSSV